MAKKLLKLSTLLGVVLVIFLLAGCPLTQPKVTLTVSEDGSGEVTLNPSGETYAKDTEVTLTAVPDEGWKFVEWSGDLSGSDNPETLVMDEDKSVTAHFEEEAPKPTITFVNVPEAVCGGDEFEAVVEVTDADDVSFVLQRGTETPIEPEIAQDGNLYTLTFESPELTEDKIYELIVEASNEDEEVIDSTPIMIYKTDKKAPEFTVTFAATDISCDATQAIVEFAVCDETALNIDSLDWEVSHGEATLSATPEVGELCLTRGELTWEFGDIDCEDAEITLFISDKCGNEASKTLTKNIDNMDPIIDFPFDPGECNDNVEVIEWSVVDNCFDGFDVFTCCEAVDIEIGEATETGVNEDGRIINTGLATLTFNDVVDCTTYDFDLTASDTCGNRDEDKVKIDKDFKKPEVLVWGFMSVDSFTSNIQALEAKLRDLLSESDPATNVTLEYGPECNAEKAYFVWLAEDDCINNTEVDFENICRTGAKVEEVNAGTIIGYQRVDLDCVTDCEEIKGELSVFDDCGNESTEEATIMIDNLAPRVKWDVEEPDCGDTETTITWDATDGSGNVHVWLEVSDGSLATNYSTDAIGEVTWTFGDIDCEELTATITVFDDCDDCWGRCDLPNGDTNEFPALNGLPCSGNYTQYSETITVDNIGPSIEDLGSYLIGAGETNCGYTKAFFSFAATENCIENAYVEYEIIGEDASETGTFGALEETLVSTETRDYTTFEGTMTLPEYDGATIVATAFVEDECHTASVTLFTDDFDNVKPVVEDWEIIPENRDCIKYGDEIIFNTLVTDNNLDDATVTWDGADASFTLVEDPTLEATYFSYSATLSIDANNVDKKFTVTMTATDNCGNTTTKTFDFTVDSIAPDLTNYEFNAKTNKLWFWLTEDIGIADEVATLTIYVWTGDGTPTSGFNPPSEGSPVVIGEWNKIVQGSSDNFFDTNEAIYYNKDLEQGWMKDILVANLEHEEFNYDLEAGVWYAFILDNVKDACGNVPPNRLSGFGEAWQFSPEF
ncbi:MAG: hypothetical protein FXF54_14340 [Kosmotoga sp.]|nr:MAG: hypothetical protein FXF54_14340 [Kosmotoga sp.]